MGQQLPEDKIEIIRKLVEGKICPFNFLIPNYGCREEEDSTCDECILKAIAYVLNDK